jgi:integrase
MALKQRKALQNADRLRAGVNWNDTDYVFTTELGRAIDPRNDFRKWEKLLVDSGVDYVKLHAARHTAATLMVVGGTPLHTVSEILGHSSIAVTADIYAHVTSAQSSTALNLLSLQIFPSDESPIELAT